MNRQLHKKYWIDELKSYGIHKGPAGEPLENLDYYALKAYLVKAQLQRDLEIKASPWF